MLTLAQLAWGGAEIQTQGTRTSRFVLLHYTALSRGGEPGIKVLKCVESILLTGGLGAVAEIIVID